MLDIDMAADSIIVRYWVTKSSLSRRCAQANT